MTSRGECIQDLLHAQALATPEATAVSFEDGSSLTYQEFHSRAARLAAALSALGVEPEGFVGVRLNRVIGAVVGVVGVLKAGAAYVPIDPVHPTARQEHIIRQSGLRVMLVGRGQVEKTRKELPYVTLVEVGPMGEVLSVHKAQCTGPTQKATVRDEPSSSRDRSLAYVLFTSGSTGLPKGVAVEHRGVVNMLRYLQSQLNFGVGDVVLGLTTFCFDISVLELFLPLMTGARLCVASSATQKDPQAIADIVEQEQVTFLQATPATFELLMAVGWRGHPRVHCVCGGEAFRLSLLPLVDECASFRNGYGPTEATVYSTVYRVPKPVDRSLKTVSIGRPLPGTTAYVLDEHMKMVPPGEPGELWVGGCQVATGYLYQPDLTAERFVEDPYAPGGGLMYRTGDLCQWSDGVVSDDGQPQLIYLGRIDTQVKINGYRIEVGEIEAVLQAAHADMGAAVVCARDDLPGGQRGLVAYYVTKAAGGASIDEQMLHAACVNKLPPYMVPRYFMQVPAMPLSPSGKVDRKALPPVGHKTHLPSHPPSTESPSVASTNESSLSTEEPPPPPFPNRKDLSHLVAKLMTEQSGAEVEPESDMTAVGMDSMGAALLLARLAANLGGLRIAPSEVYGHVTVKDFALHLQKRVASEKPKLLRQLGLECIEMANAHQVSASGKVNAASSSRNRLMDLTNALTGMRGIMILWVVAQHFSDPAWLAPLARRFSSNTWLFVVLSGFSLMLQRMTTPTGRHWSVRSFLQSKAVGLFPIYYTAIVLTLPRYIALVTNPVAYDGDGWRKTGILRTNYHEWQTYVWDWLFLLTGMQTWVDEVNHRTMNSLYYGSVQWSLYLVFALVAWFGGQRVVTSLLKKLEKSVGGPVVLALMCVLLANTAHAVGTVLHPSLLHTYTPLLFLASFFGGMGTARALLILSERANEGFYQRIGCVGQLLFTHASDIVAGVIIYIIFLPWGLCPMDTVFGEAVIPVLFCVMLLLFGLHMLRRDNGSMSKPILLHLYDTEAAMALGRLSFAIYLYHEVIGDVYFQMAVKNYFTQWHGLIPPKGTPWEVYSEVFVGMWMSGQSFVLKIGAFSVSILLGWLVQRYITGHALIQMLASVERAGVFVTKLFKPRTRRAGDVMDEKRQSDDGLELQQVTVYPMDELGSVTGCRLLQ